jgi:oxygen-independent coproporphyrinogen III oxidase
MEASLPPPTKGNIRKWMHAAMQQGMLSYVYTYPPKEAYLPFAGGIEECWRGHAGKMNLYIHFPYCKMKCSYCNLFSHTRFSRAQLTTYAQALRSELQLAAQMFDRGKVTIDSIHLGGGTPSLFDTRDLVSLLDDIHHYFRVSENAEVAIEVTPTSIDEQSCAELRRAGVSRISIGIQSFNADELANMRRRRHLNSGQRAMELAIDAGFPNINLDFIYGLAGQTLTALLSNLRFAAQYPIPTITLYSLVLREGTACGRAARAGTEQFIDGREHYRWYDQAVQVLTEMGYQQLTLVLFARPGGGNRFEENEFLSIPTLGLGAGSRSYSPTLHYTSDDYYHRRTSSSAIIDQHLDAVLRQKRIPVRCAAHIDEDERLRRETILRLLYFRGIDELEYEAQFGENIRQRFAEQLDILDEADLLQWSSKRLQLNQDGLKYSSLIARLFYADHVFASPSAYR